MSLDDNKAPETTMTYAEVLRMRGYDEKWIEQAVKRREKRLLKLCR